MDPICGNESDSLSGVGDSKGVFNTLLTDL